MRSRSTSSWKLHDGEHVSGVYRVDRVRQLREEEDVPREDEHLAKLELDERRLQRRKAERERLGPVRERLEEADLRAKGT